MYEETLNYREISYEVQLPTGHLDHQWALLPACEHPYLTPVLCFFDDGNEEMNYWAKDYPPGTRVICRNSTVLVPVNPPTTQFGDDT